MTFNSRLAQELGKWAEEQGRGDEFHLAAFRAYFVDGLNLAQVPVLTGIARSIGLDPDEAQAALEARAFREAVDRDWARSRASGVTAVPSFVAGGRIVVGAQPFEVLEQLILAAGARPRGPRH